MAAWPNIAATMSCVILGGPPSLFARVVALSTVAPPPSSTSTVARSPNIAAQWSGVEPRELARSASAREASSASTVDVCPYTAASAMHDEELNQPRVRAGVPLAAFTSAPRMASTGTSVACPFSAARLSAVQRSRSLCTLTSAP
eukprot:3670201-Prymnesium_polylepis.2